MPVSLAVFLVLALCQGISHSDAQNVGGSDFRNTTTTTSTSATTTENNTTENITKGIITTGTTTIRTTATETTTFLNCSTTFSVNLFKVFFDEGCLADLSSQDHCMVNTAEAFLKELFGEVQVLSMGMAPWLLYVYVTTALLGSIPDLNHDRASWRTKLAFVLWLSLQVGTCLFQLLSMLWYVLGYMSMHWSMSECFTKVGSASYMHLTVLPVASFQMAAVNKMVPLFITLAVLLMEFAHHNVVCAQTISVAVGCVVAFPFVVGLVYCAGTLSILFSVIFLPLPIVEVGVVALGLAMLFFLSWALRGPLEYLSQTFNLDLLWFESWKGGWSEDPYTIVSMVALTLMIISPLITLGTILSFAVYSGVDAGEVIVWVYDYCFASPHFVFRLPSFADFEALFDDFPQSLWRTLADLSKFSELPPDDALLIGITAGVFGTVLNMLRSFIFTGNSILFVLTKGKGDWGVPVKPIKKKPRAPGWDLVI